MDYGADIAVVAAALANRARVTMVTALLDGNAHLASDLARESGIARSTASAHLAELVRGGLVVLEREGRQHRFRLRGPEVAEVLEALGALAPPRAVSARGGLEAARLRAGRTCYDHLAGRLGIAITDALVAAETLRVESGGFTLTQAGARRLEGVGIDVSAARARRRAFTVACLDWTERRRHLGGALGAALCSRLIDGRWVRRIGPDRAVELTPIGESSLRDALGDVWRTVQSTVKPGS